MTTPLRSTLERRRYRMAQALVIGGSLAAGLLVLSRLVDLLGDGFASYYGVGEFEMAQAQRATDAALPLTAWQLLAALTSLLVVCTFVWSERRRLAQARELRGRAASMRSIVVETRVCGKSLFDQVVLRTSGYAGALLTLWLVQSCLERSLGGLGWGIAYEDWQSVLPLASVFGLCVLVGILVASVSLFGLRTIHVLELVLRGIRVRRSSSFRLWRTRSCMRSDLRTIRELIGCDVLSRPPPVWA